MSSVWESEKVLLVLVLVVVLAAIVVTMVGASFCLGVPMVAFDEVSDTVSLGE